ncbi:MAG: Hpt domain-containing protein [Nonlabens sp.]
MEEPNLSYIKKLSQGDKEFEDQIFNVMQEEFPLERLSYEEAVEAEDFKDCAARVHKLKHKISILGLSAGYQAAVEYENELRQQSFEGKTDFETVLDRIELFLKDRE